MVCRAKRFCYRSEELADEIVEREACEEAADHHDRSPVFPIGVPESYEKIRGTISCKHPIYKSTKSR